MQKLQWGQVMGEALGVPGYSNNNFKYDPKRAHEYQSYLSKNQSKLARDVYLGFKYQCVEYARRFLVMTQKVAFLDVPCAYDIWQVNTVEDLTTQDGQHQFVNLKQGGSEPPRVGDLLIYYRSPKQPYGHVAVVTNVQNDFVDIAEQNYEEQGWANKSYSRRLVLKEINGNYELTNIRKGLESQFAYCWDRHEKLYGWKRVIG